MASGCVLLRAMYPVPWHQGLYCLGDAGTEYQCAGKNQNGTDADVAPTQK